MRTAAIVAGILAALWIAGGITTVAVMYTAIRNAPTGGWWTGEDDAELERILNEENA